MNRERMLSAVLLTTVTFIGVSGCGDDPADETSRGSGLSTEPARLMQDMIRSLGTATRPEECKAVTRISQRSRTAVVCPVVHPQRRAEIRSIELNRARVYAGLGAVVDYRLNENGDGPERHAAAILVKHRDGDWSLGDFELPTSERTSLDDSSGFRKGAVAAYFSALLEQNCDRFLAWAATHSRNRQVACRDELPRNGKLLQMMREMQRAGIDIDPRYRGGDARFAFYTLQAHRGDDCIVISTVKNPARYLHPYAILGTDVGAPNCRP